MKKTITLVLLLLISVASTSYGQKDTKKQIQQREQKIFPDSLVKAEVLLLGLFHFSYPGLDTHKTKDDLRVDILSKERQEQVKELTNLIAKFKPTKIVVEYPATSQDKLDEQFKGFSSEDLKTKRNEIYQIGFRLAKQLNHDKVYAFDSRFIKYSITTEDSTWMAKQFKEGQPKIQPLEDRYFSYFAYRDTLAHRNPLKDYLLYINSDEALRRSHSVYLVQTKIGTSQEPAGADGFITKWYNRNIRMFSNVQRMADKGDRILVLTGSGHVPILKHLVENAPDLKLRRLDEFVK